jgi:cellulose synthase/poly-beta-1,6-N-acetylglucosamine synthase-like glycosyltransferase
MELGVSFIIAAYNEEKVMAEKISNALSMDYPKNKIEFIVVSDGSTDETRKIVETFANEGVLSMHNPARGGKTSALNRGVKFAKHEIIIFSDANSMFRKDAVKKLVRHFNDEQIGGVCGRKTILNNSQRKASKGDSLFWKYESLLKSAESNLGSVPTADGEIFALRKKLFNPLNENIINDDLAITLDIVSKGKRIVYDQDAITEEEASISINDDFNVKARMVYGSIQILSIYTHVLNPLTSWFGLQFFIHKTLRYFMWILLVLLLIANICCAHVNFFYKSMLYIQLIFYVSAISGLTLDRLGYPIGIFYFPYYYCNVNIAAFKGFIFFLHKKSHIEIWKKALR